MMFELNKRQTEIAKLLISDAYTVSELAFRYSVSEKTIRTDLSSISLFISRHSLILKKEKPARYSISGPSSSLEKFPLLLGSTLSPMEERPYLIVMALCASPLITYQKLADICGVSRQTIINTMERVETILEKEELAIKKEPHHGLSLAGKELNIRSLFHKGLQTVPDCAFMDLGFDKTRMKEALRTASRFTQQTNCASPDFVNRLLAFSLYRYSAGYPVEFSGSIDNPLFQGIPSENERSYLSYLFASGGQDTDSLCLTESSQNRADEVASSLLHALKKLHPSEFDIDESLIQAFTTHIQAAVCRLQMGMDVDNPILPQIKMTIPFLFEFTSRELDSISSSLGIRFSQNEIAYLAMYLDSIFESGLQFEKLKVLVVCNFGLATGFALKTRLEKMAFDCAFTGPLSVADAKQRLREETFDLVITNCRFECSIPFLVVSSMLTPQELSLINNRLNQDSYTKTCNHFINCYSKAERTTHFLTDYIPAENIQLSDRTMDWSEAIREAARPLVENGKITKGYVNRMVEAVLEYGTYMVLTPETAYVHAGVEDGVLENCTSMLILPSVISFGQKKIKPVKNIVVLGILEKDKNSLLEIASILEKEENISLLRQYPLPENLVRQLHD